MPEPLIFFSWLECDGKEADTAVYVVAPDQDKAMDYLKHLTHKPYHDQIRLEQVSEMTRPIGYLSWNCWQAELEAHAELRK